MTSTQLEQLLTSYQQKQTAIRTRLDEFSSLQKSPDNSRLFEELAYCIFTAGASARMGLNSVLRVRTLLQTGSQEEIHQALIGAHRYPNARAGYLVTARKFLLQDCQLKLSDRLHSLSDDFQARRDFFVTNIKGIGYKEASHFLRNIGFRGYAILDKHILKTLCEFGVIPSVHAPTTKKNYILIEERMRNFAFEININFDELDLLLWSNKTGEILK